MPQVSENKPAEVKVSWISKTLIFLIAAYLTIYIFIILFVNRFDLAATVVGPIVSILPLIFIGRFIWGVQTLKQFAMRSVGLFITLMSIYAILAFLKLF